MGNMIADLKCLKNCYVEEGLGIFCLALEHRIETNGAEVTERSILAR